MTSFYEELRKTDSISDEKENEQSRKNIDKWIFRLLLCVLGLVPIIVLANIEEVISPLISDVDLLSSGVKGELFTNYKALLTTIITVIISLLFLAKIFFMGGKIKQTPMNYVLCVCVVIFIVSAVTSPNITIALNGQYNRSDGTISWLCYMILLFIAANIEYPKNNVIHYILYTMMPFIYVNVIIITMNFYGNDLMQKAWLQSFVSMVLPEGATISQGSELVGTLNQWNYMSGMFSIMAVMYLMAAILESKMTHRITYLITAIVSVAVMLMSISSSGFVTFCICMIFIILAIAKSRKKIKNSILLLIFLLVNIPVLHILASENSRVWDESLGNIVTENPYFEEGSVTYNTEKNLIEWDFISKAYASDNFTLPELPERTYGSGSGRLFIWEHTLDLVSERLLIGYGLDTLMYNFPQFNIDTRAAYWYDNVVTDKPHNIYMGLLYGTGVIGFFSIIILIVYLSVQVIIKAFNVNNPIYWIIGVAWLAYLIQALFNDSLPGISSTMWIFAGILLAQLINEKEKANGRHD